MRQILVPLDGSQTAEAILPAAVAFARAESCALQLVRVIADGPAGNPHGTRSAPRQTTLERRAAHAYLRVLADALRATQLPIGATIREGSPAATILRMAGDDPGICAIAIGTHGRSGPPRWAFGSVAEHLLARSPVPLLLARSPGSEADPEVAPAYLPLDLERRYNRIVVPIDGSAVAETVLPHLQTLAAGQRQIHLVTALPAPIGAVPALARRQRARQGAALADALTMAASRLSAQGFQVVVHLVEGEPAEQVHQLAARVRADLIAMATHQRAAFGRLVSGSFVIPLLHQATIPLFVVPAAASARTSIALEAAAAPPRSGV